MLAAEGRIGSAPVLRTPVSAHAGVTGIYDKLLSQGERKIYFELQKYIEESSANADPNKPP
jgi:hypothetical protein